MQGSGLCECVYVCTLTHKCILPWFQIPNKQVEDIAEVCRGRFPSEQGESWMALGLLFYLKENMGLLLLLRGGGHHQP